jgi:hypothetical protein
MKSSDIHNLHYVNSQGTVLVEFLSSDVAEQFLGGPGLLDEVGCG